LFLYANFILHIQLKKSNYLSKIGIKLSFWIILSLFKRFLSYNLFAKLTGMEYNLKLKEL